MCVGFWPQLEQCHGCMLIHELRQGQFWSWFSNLRGPCTSFPVDSHVGCHDKCAHTLARGLFSSYATRSLVYISLSISPHQHNIPSTSTGDDRPSEKSDSTWNASLLTPVSYHTTTTNIKNNHTTLSISTGVVQRNHNEFDFRFQEAKKLMKLKIHQDSEKKKLIS